MALLKNIRVGMWGGALVIAALSNAAMAQESPKDLPGVHGDVGRLMPSLGNVAIGSIVELPVNGLVAIETEGEILFVSKNGRYVFSGKAHDLWYDKSLADIDTIEVSATTLSFDLLGVDTSELNTLTIGTGRPDTPFTVFIDPLCDSCMEIVEAAVDQQSDYTFHFVIIPALGDPSHEAAYRFACRDESVTHEQSLDALLSQTLTNLPGEEGCVSDVYRTTLALAEMVRVDGVPYSVSHEGKVMRGEPDGFVDWIEEQL